MSDAASNGGVKGVFVNPEEGRLRTGWRLLVLVVAVFFAAIPQAALLLPGPTDGVLRTITIVSIHLLVYAGMTGVVLGVARYVDRRRLVDLGLGRPGFLREVGVGVVIGFGMLVAVATAALALGLARIEGTFVTRPGLSVPGMPQGMATGVGGDVPFVVGFLGVVLFYVGVAVFEEVLFRGYLVPNVAEGLRSYLPNRRVAVGASLVLTSIVFGAGHLANPGSGALAGLNVSLVGLLLAWAFVTTEDLGVPIGIHFGWNATLGAVFGFPVSGLGSPATVVALEVTGDPLLTGGAFGPEAGLLAYVGLAVGVAAVWIWLDRTDRSIDVDPAFAVPTLRGDGGPDAAVAGGEDQVATEGAQAGSDGDVSSESGAASEGGAASEDGIDGP